MSFAVGISHGECDTGACPCKLVSIATTIWTAAEQGDLSAIRSKVSKAAMSANKMDNYGYTTRRSTTIMPLLISFLIRMERCLINIAVAQHRCIAQVGGVDCTVIMDHDN